jgi:hypothetical protein
MFGSTLIPALNTVMFLHLGASVVFLLLSKRGKSLILKLLRSLQRKAVLSARPIVRFPPRAYSLRFVPNPTLRIFIFIAHKTFLKTF